MENITDFLEKGEVFFEQLEEGEFDKKIFYQYVKNVSKVSGLSLELSLRQELTNSVWRASLKIQSLIISHYDQNDIFEIENLEAEEIYNIRETLLCLASGFSTGRALDEKSLIWSPNY